MTKFRASVQYNDFKGTAAADHADQNHLTDYLRAKGLMNEGEFVLASSVWIGENRDGKVGHVGISAFLFNLPDATTVKDALDALAGPIPVRTVRLEITLEEFLCLFKRVEIFLTRKGFGIDDREYKEI